MYNDVLDISLSGEQKPGLSSMIFTALVGDFGKRILPNANWYTRFKQDIAIIRAELEMASTKYFTKESQRQAKRGLKNLKRQVFDADINFRLRGNSMGYHTVYLTVTGAKGKEFIRQSFNMKNPLSTMELLEVLAKSAARKAMLAAYSLHDKNYPIVFQQ